MNVKTVAVAIAVAVTQLAAQNMVLNPGFESRQETVQNGLWMLAGDMFSGYNVKGWSQPTNGSSDYFYRNASGQTNITLYGGAHEPAGGSAFVGFINWLPGREYREYVTGELLQPLEKGKTYVFKMKICTGNICSHLVDELGVYFSAERFSDKSTEKTVRKTPQVKLDVRPMHDAPEEWIMVENIFVAQGGEKYFTFGNFLNDSNTTVKELREGQVFQEYAYYYADDIVVEPSDGIVTVPSTNPTFSDQFQPGKTFIARGINFDLDKATLRPESYLQLHEISAELKRKNTLKVEIRGYTDSSGNEPHNIQLSKARAKAVADYLVSTGIERSRITYGGYGSAEPVSVSQPELNRRVEFVFK